MEREIQQTEWRAFFDEYSRRHDGWLVSVECDRAGTAFRDLPLRGITVDDRAIEVFAHAPDGAHMTHVIRGPVRVISDTTSEGGDVAVTILNAAGGRTVVQFRSAIPAQLVNGYTGGMRSLP